MQDGNMQNKVIFSSGLKLLDPHYVLLLSVYFCSVSFVHVLVLPFFISLLVASHWSGSGCV